MERPNHHSGRYVRLQLPVVGGWSGGFAECLERCSGWRGLRVLGGGLLVEILVIAEVDLSCFYMFLYSYF